MRVCRVSYYLSLFMAISISYSLAKQAVGDDSMPAENVKPSDVRLVIDVSGSMKRNDPNNLRQPAVDLLVQLLPEGSKAGIWTFGKWVNMLVPHKPVDIKWREKAQDKAAEINSVGLFTNIGEALEKAAYDRASPSEKYRTSIILLTDGMVDIDKNPQANKKEWRRIVDEVLPKLKQAGYTIHTIALSENADTNLLNKLSLGTDGIAEIANSADELMKIFLKAFDVAAPAEQVPLSDNSFVIDSSIEEFTALIFRKNPSENTELIGPDDKVYKHTSRSNDVNWYRSSNYDLITVQRPLEGEWKVNASMDPDSRVTIVSNLNLRVKPLPNNVFRDQVEKLTLLLQEDGKTIKREEFLSLMTIDANMEAGNDEFELKTFWTERLSGDVPPANGVYSKELPKFSKDGIYQLNVIVDGKSFSREFSHQFSVREPFGAEIVQRFNDGRVEFILSVRVYSDEVNIDKTQLVATLVDPEGGKKVRPLVATDVDTWELNLKPYQEGDYVVKLKIKGEDKSGNKFEQVIDDLTFNYSIDGGFEESKEPFFEEEPKPETKEEPQEKPEEKPEENGEQDAPAAEEESEASEDVEKESEEEAGDEEETETPAWIMYAILGGGNLLLFGVGFFLFRKIMSGDNTEEILEELAEESGEEQNSDEGGEETEVVEETVEEPPALEAMTELDSIEEEEVEEEPPMEDLDPDEDDDAVEPSEPPPPLEEIDLPAQQDDESEAPEMEALEEPEVESVTEDEDDLDDLDAMALEPEASDDDMEVDIGEDDEEEDMVTAMLKAQGLDLAEEELDDAISSLIDDLDDDQPEPDGDIDLDDFDLDDDVK